MLKVLLVGSHLNYNLEHYTKIALENLGHKVVFFGYRDILKRTAPAVRMTITRSAIIRELFKPIFLTRLNGRLRDTASKVQPDLLLSVKGETVFPETVTRIRKDLGVKTALWYPDDPRFFESLVKDIAPHYDYVFTASERAVKAYEKIGVRNVKYLPFACEPSIHRKVELTNEERKRLSSDVCFVGTYYPERGRIVGKLRGFGVSVYGPYWQFFRKGAKAHKGIWGDEMVKAFNAAKIVLNIHIKEDLEYKANMRTFEATGSGAFLLTDKPSGLENLFIPNKEVVCYNEKKEILELVEYYLDADDERASISLNGQERAYRDHTYEQRARKILETTGLSQ